MELVSQFSPRLLVRLGHGGFFVQYFREFLHFTVCNLLALPLGLLVGLRQGILGFIEPLLYLLVFYLRGVVGACYTRFFPAPSLPEVFRLPGELCGFSLFRCCSRPFHGLLDAFADGLGIDLPAGGVLSDPCLYSFFHVVEDRSRRVFRAHLAAGGLEETACGGKCIFRSRPGRHPVPPFRAPGPQVRRGLPDNELLCGIHVPSGYVRIRTDGITFCVELVRQFFRASGLHLRQVDVA